MKRLAASEPTGLGLIPTTFEPESGMRDLFVPLRVKNPRGSSGCWSCPDIPCMRWSTAEIEKEGMAVSPVQPDPLVCPSDALSIDASGVPVVDNDRCIGCGLCVARCPVGAICLDPTTALPKVGALVTGEFRGLERFAQMRLEAAEKCFWRSAPFDDADLVAIQVARARPFLVGVAGGLILQRLARNTFLVSGVSARSRIDGSNAAWAELAVSGDGLIAPIEIESGGETLDAMRRLLAGVALLVSEHGLDSEAVLPAVVVIALPNQRVDYFRVVTDARKYLNVSVRTVPVALLLLAIRDQETPLLQRFEKARFVAEGDSPSVVEDAAESYGPLAHVEIGLSPTK